MAEHDGKSRSELIGEIDVLRGELAQATSAAADCRRAARLLEASERRYRMLVETQTDLVVEFDSDWRLLFVSPSYCETFGESEKELLGKEFMPLVHEEDRPRIAESLRSLSEPPHTSQHEERALTKDGWRWFSWSATAAIDGDGQILAIVSVGRDITQQKRMEQQLRQRQTLEAVGQLAGGLAHDFNNQRATIMGYADMIKCRAEDEAIERYGEKVLSAARSSAELTNQLLTFARRGKHLSVPVDVQQVVGDAVKLLQRSIDKRITIQQALKARPDATTRGDPSQLQNALLHIGINARDAMPNGGELTFATEVVTVEEDASPGLAPEAQPGCYVKVSVRDTGAGMADEVMGRVFEPFFTTKEKGTGMGLAAVYGAVRSHGGAVGVESEVGQGSTFHILLPLYDDVRAVRDGRGRIRPIGKGAGVLLVDDEDHVREMSAELLTELGFEVKTSRDGVEAVRCYRKHWRDIDLVILDMIMPRMGGKQAFHAMRRMNPDVKAIVISGYDVDGEAQSVLDEGALGFLQKPFKIAEISRIIGNALEA